MILRHELLTEIENKKKIVTIPATLFLFYKINDRIEFTHDRIGLMHDRTIYTHDTIGLIHDTIG